MIIIECKRWTVYKHTNKFNKKCYIGITSQISERRWQNGNGYSWQEKFYRAIKKYGWNNFDHEILFENLTDQEAENKEQTLIKEYNSTNNSFGYNVALGGKVHSVSEETKEKISKSKKGVPLLEDNKQKLSKSHIGKKLSPEHVEKIRSKNKGKKRSQEFKDRMKEKMSGKYDGENHPQYGKPRREETKEKIKTGLIGKYKGEKNPNFGKKLSDETKRKIGESNKKRYESAPHPKIGKHLSEESKNKIGKANGKPIICENIEFESIVKCAEFYNIKHSTMHSWLKGINKMPEIFMKFGLRYK